MRPWLVASLAVALVLLGLLLGLMMPRHCPVTREAFGRIEEGMTRTEVYAILGGPPEDYRTRPHAPPPRVISIHGWIDGDVEVWEGDEGRVVVVFVEPPLGQPAAGFTDFAEAEPYDCSLFRLVCWRLEKFRAALPP